MKKYLFFIVFFFFLAKAKAQQEILYLPKYLFGAQFDSIIEFTNTNKAIIKLEGSSIDNAYKISSNSISIADSALRIDADSSYHPRNTFLNTATKTLTASDFGKRHIIGSNATFTFDEFTSDGLELGDYIEFVKTDNATVTIQTSGGATIEFSNDINSSNFTINETGIIFFISADLFLFIGD